MRKALMTSIGSLVWATFSWTEEQEFCSRACVRKATYEKHEDGYRKARMERYRAEKKTAAGRNKCTGGRA